jgi:hypothetical protein
MVVYWCDVVNDELVPNVEDFPDGEDQIGKLLARCSELREQGKFFVTSTSHHCTGVAGVIDGKLPDGTVYQWRKRRPY